MTLVTMKIARRPRSWLTNFGSRQERKECILRFPARWRLYAFPWDDFGDLWHGDVWRRYVVNDLAEAWARSPNVTADQLKPWWKGFPRGRIERVGVQEYTVFHADDIS